jgi:hypothetical protein
VAGVVRGAEFGAVRGRIVAYIHPVDTTEPWMSLVVASDEIVRLGD